MSDPQVLADRYELGAVLGRGGMAEVRAGWDLRLGRAVAIKTLLPALAGQAAVRRRFEGEARAAARLAHPNVVAVFDVGEESGVPFLVMEQVVGPTLEEEMRRGPLGAGRVRRLAEEVLGALGAAHSAGLVHRDVKPANVLISPDGSAKVADFGIAKAIADEDATVLEGDLTIAGQLLGTVAYMAPERLAGRPATVQSDIYSVGVVLYEGLTGARPFPAPTPIAMVRAIDQASPAPLREACPELDAALIAAVERAMARNPGDRFSTAGEMSAALLAGPTAPEDTADAPTILVAPMTQILDPPARPTWAGRLTGRWIVALLAAAGLAVALIAVALIAAAVGGGNPPDPGGTPAVTAPPTTLAPPPPAEIVTATTSATPPPTAGRPEKGKGKGKK